MNTDTRRYGSLASKAIAVLLIVVCFAVGAVGLILPIIPGLLFVAIALMLIASFFPAVDRQLRKNRTIRSYLDSAEGFRALRWPQRIRYGCLLTLRVFVDTVAFCVYAVSKLLSFAVVRYQSYR